MHGGNVPVYCVVNTKNPKKYNPFGLFFSFLQSSLCFKSLKTHFQWPIMTFPFQ